MNADATEELTALFEIAKIFSHPKPTKLLKNIISIVAQNDGDIILDFFSGSGTAADAVMQTSLEKSLSLKYIMVQLPESLEESMRIADNNAKAALEAAITFLRERKMPLNLTEIGKERIRRAGEKIKEEVGLTAHNLDIGYRVLKLDDTNMNDVYYAATETTQDMLTGFESNIKPDRTDMDLLFGCLLDWGLPLSMPHTHETIDGATVHTYNDGDLIACFADNINDSVVKEIAKRQPLRAVFRDSSFTSSPEKINVAEIFKLLAPNTTVRVI
jgi:adenine-specific DNA-methyltransferase